MPVGAHHWMAPAASTYQLLPIASSRPSGSISSVVPQQLPRSGPPPGSGGNATAAQLVPVSFEMMSGYRLMASTAATAPGASPINSEVEHALSLVGHPGIDQFRPPFGDIRMLSHSP